MKSIRWLNILLFSLLSYHQCWAFDTSTQVFSLAIEQRPNQLRWDSYLNYGEWYLHYNIVATLVEIDQNNQIRSGLARKWLVSSDQKKYIFTLKNDAKWSNGEIITPHDILFSFLRSSSHNSAKYLQRIVKTVNGSPQIYLNQDDNLVIELAKPNKSFLYFLTRPEYGITHRNTIDFITENTITSGDYQISQVNQSTLTLSPNHYNNRISSTSPRQITFIHADSHGGTTQLLASGRLSFIQVRGTHDVSFAKKNMQYYIEDAGFDNLMTLQGRKLNHEQQCALKHLSKTLEKRKLSKHLGHTAHRFAAYTDADLQFSYNYTDTCRFDRPIQLSLLAHSDPAILSLAKNLSDFAKEHGIIISIETSDSYHNLWKNEDYELTLKEMGVYTYDEVELFLGYFCAGYKPYKSLEPIICDHLSQAATAINQTSRKIHLNAGYQNMINSGMIIPLYFYPRQFLINSQWERREHNPSLPYPIFRTFFEAHES